MLFFESKVRFIVPSHCEHGCHPLMREQSLHSVRGSLNGPDHFQGEYLDMSSAQGDSTRCSMYLLFDRLQFLVLSYRLYSDWEIWAERERYQSQEQTLLGMFDDLPYSAVKLLGV